MTFATWANSIVSALNTYIVPLIFALALLMFMWGVVNYFFLGAGDETKRSEGRQFVIWGILGMVVLFSVWGLVALVLSTLGVASGA